MIMANNESDILFNELFNELDKMAEKEIENIEKTMYEQILYQNHINNENLARLEQRWWKGFVALEAMYLMTVEVAKKYHKDIGYL